MAYISDYCYCYQCLNIAFSYQKPGKLLERPEYPSACPLDPIPHLKGVDFILAGGYEQDLNGLALAYLMTPIPVGFFE